MASSNVAEVGDKITLVHVVNHKIVDPRQYVSQLLDFVEYDKAILSVPIENGRVIPLSIGTVYEACFVTQKGLYKCECEIVDRFKEGNMFQMLVKFVTAFEKYQRREYYRLEIIKDFVFRLVPPEEDALIAKISEDNFANDLEKSRFVNTLNSIQNKWVKATTVDISGGGMRYVSPQERTREKKLEVKLELDISGKKYEMIVPADIIAFNRAQMTGNYEYRIKFSDISRGEREQIIKFIFEEERKRRNKGSK